MKCIWTNCVFSLHKSNYAQCHAQASLYPWVSPATVVVSLSIIYIHCNAAFLVRMIFAKTKVEILSCEMKL